MLCISLFSYCKGTIRENCRHVAGESITEYTQIAMMLCELLKKTRKGCFELVIDFCHSNYYYAIMCS